MKHSCIHKISLAISLSLLLGSCVSEFNADLPDSENNILIVDGAIISDSSVIFQLSKSISVNEIMISPEDIDVRANLSIIGSDESQSKPATYLGAGKYEIKIDPLKEDVSYGIRIEYEGDIYQSALSKPLATPEIEKVSWKQPMENGDVSFHVSTKSNDNEPKYFLWNYEEDWETTAHYYVTIFYNPNTQKFYTTDTAPAYYCWRKNRINKILIGATKAYTENRIVDRQLYQVGATESKFSYLYSVNVIQQAIDKAGYEYYLSKLKMNEEMGGLFTPQPSDWIGNISCVTDPSKKAAGYISVVKNITQKRIFINSGEISKAFISSYCTTELPEEVKELTDLERYQIGYRPVVEAMGPPEAEPTPESWSIVRCTDCIYNGGTKNKPGFWPNDHK
ncbi:hypothetical protein FACS189420_2840 [Bacteroidia bacterium]|nr:hypothetical protein FACS189420_2840 [Bacteroidia bacterium]